MITATQFRKRLMAWYGQNGRELPWRGTKDAYRIWVSEIILQQTRVEQGRSYYEAFVEQFPTVERLAEAAEDTVLKAWEGLGYYSRARNLHAAAQQIRSAGGSLPQTYQGLLQMKGVGPYTAAAIGSMAFGLKEAAVDGNVSRVLSRIFGISTPIDSPEGQKIIAEKAREILDESRPGDHNQAMMDFGAMQCVPKAPQCEGCIMADACQALRQGMVSQLPVKQKKAALRHRYLHYIYVTDGRQTLIHRRSRQDIWRGLYEPLLIETPEESSIEVLKGPIIDRLMAQPGTTLRPLTQGKRHQLTHRQLHVNFFLLTVTPQAIRSLTLPEGFRLIPIGDIHSYAYPILIDWEWLTEEQKT
ncbi:MAG: A/G-specific adenine glycosylase [Bacteroidaceae bacterium]|nr:A/G-specific adenine glycosylase [Bacteroidaceae bacterium]